MKIHKQDWAIHCAADIEADGRYALGGVCLSHHDGTSSATATDGRLLVNVQWKEEAEELINHVVPVKDCKAVVKLAGTKRECSKAPSAAEFNVSQAKHGAINIHGYRDNRIVYCVDGRFPKWQDCVPKLDKENSTSVHVTPALLRRMAAALDDGGCEMATIIVPHDGESAIMFEGERGDRHFTGLLMPYVVD